MSLKSILFLIYFSLFAGGINYSQESTLESAVLNPFNEYTKIPREVVYVHLNKSVYLKGESLGFTAYVFDKNNKSLSNITTNLYCTIIDKNSNTVKKKLIQVENGIASGQFNIDSLFSSGNYTFKAYTNWMRNFNERNLYAQSIEVIDSDITSEIKTKIISNQVDAQFLPEGGHIISDAENSMGVIIKDSLGYGVPLVEGKILNKEGLEITTFKTNEFGIGKFSYIAKKGMGYKAVYSINNNIQEKNLNMAETKGINLKLTDLGTKIALAFNTNSETLPDIKEKSFSLTFHNGKTIKAVGIKFEESLQTIKVVDYDDLFSGINVITLFDSNQNPILERLFFKYDGLKFLTSGLPSAKSDMDSINIQIPIKEAVPGKFSNFSVSVLPKNNISYGPAHNIASSILLQPYLKGYIENGSYYFTEIDRKKKYYLDNLLLTQGWSSYDWDYVFSNPPKNLYNFETGITINAKINKMITGQYLVYPTRKSKSNVLALDKNESSFQRTEFFPYEEDKLKIGEILKNGKVGNPSIFLQFSPSKIPSMGLDFEITKPKTSTYMEFSNSETFKPAWDKVEELEEVLITTEKEANRLEKLRRNSSGNVDIFDDAKRQQYFDIASYLSAKGFRVNTDGANMSIINTSSPTPNNRVPVVYLDNMRLFDFNLLINYQMNNIDYIVIDKNGFGEGIRGSAGVIKIFTDPSVSLIKTYGKNYQEFDIPLTFSEKKRFYTPVYTSYSSTFFKNYGVIGWIPNISLDNSGYLNFNIFDANQSSVNLYIEGVTENGSFMSEIKTITID